MDPERLPRLATNETSQKEVICYSCALRMSILHRLPPPRTLFQLKNDTCANENLDSCAIPLADHLSHPHFLIVHETDVSAQRCLTSDSEVVRLQLYGSTTRPAKPAAEVTWLCVACLGLYQFMDLIYAPIVAASVRRSPFTDTDRVSVNISTHRSFTFLWLAVSTRYFDMSSTKDNNSSLLPNPSDIIPEELSNFKDFFANDFRARVMFFLRSSHEELLAQPPTLNLTAYKRNFCDPTCDLPQKKLKIEGDPSTCSSTECLSFQAFEYAGDGEGISLNIDCGHPPTAGVVTESGLPPEYCSNRAECVLKYGVIYQYICPYLSKNDWGPPYITSPSCSRPLAMLDCLLSHANIFLLGNYRKMSRSLSQSPWFSRGERVGSFSLQEVIAAPILPFFFPEGVTPNMNDVMISKRPAEFPPNGVLARRNGVSDNNTDYLSEVHPSVTASSFVFGFGRYKFHSAGREDVDVRMLGTGRPFVLEIVSPSRQRVTDADLQRLTDAINSSENGCVEINQLRITDASVTVRLAKHSESKVKRYRAVVWLSSRDESGLSGLIKEVNNMKDVVVQQKTPLRVLHRRSLHTRSRTIHSMRLSSINSHWYLLDIETQAGTYIKEFVHGDMGRTLPNLGTLLKCRADIVQLDVVDMLIEDVDG